MEVAVNQFLVDISNKVQILTSYLGLTYSFSKMTFQCTTYGLAMHNFLLFFDTIYNFLLLFLWSSCYPYLECPLSFLPVEIISVLQETALTVAAAAAKSRQSCPTLCNPIDGRPPGFPVPGILQARTLEWVAIPSPMHESEKWKWSRSVVPDSSDTVDYSPPGSSVHGIFQAKVLEWGAIAFSGTKY